MEHYGPMATRGKLAYDRALACSFGERGAIHATRQPACLSSGPSGNPAEPLGTVYKLSFGSATPTARQQARGASRKCSETSFAESDRAWVTGAELGHCRMGRASGCLCRPKAQGTLCAPLSSVAAAR
jgi:hypothetical protein